MRNRFVVTERLATMIHESVKDLRSERIIFLSHCCLNQNAKVRGIARYPGAIRPLVELLLDAGVGMYQMVCPEMTYIGAMRWGHVKDQYNSPMFRRHCLQIATETLDQAEEYVRSGYSVLGFVMMDGSPVCGFNKTPQPATDQVWGGMCRYVPASLPVQDHGVYCQTLIEEAQKRPILSGVPFVAFPEGEELGSSVDSLRDIKALLM
jgi:predicted secreted protein